MRSLPLPKKPQRALLSVEELDTLVRELGPVYGPMARAMAITGMGPGEYWGEWEERRDRVHIEGTKRSGRVRDVPKVEGLALPIRTKERFNRVMEQTSWRPYDLRRTFSRLMEDAEIPRTRRQLYMGHGTKDVTDLYERYEVEEYLREDAKRLGAVLHRRTKSQTQGTRKSRKSPATIPATPKRGTVQRTRKRLAVK